MKQNCTKVFTASFTGKIYDAEAGMYYFNVCWYDSEWAGLRQKTLHAMELTGMLTVIIIR
ncbi:MAG: hypothetical protein MR958_00215 [Spirochaetia bacterium]|nr:hypothetical protein [Spirochaetia bacterium]MDD7269381.1 hypothetical protein [Treponema sp.]